MILLGVSLVVASCCSYFVIDAFGQQSFDLNCPKNAYHGLDNQGNEICRDVLTNEILESEPIDFNTLNLSAPFLSQISPIILANDNFIVMNPLIDILTISDSIGVKIQNSGLLILVLV